MIFIAIRAARDVFAIIGVECGAGECGASFHAVVQRGRTALMNGCQTSKSVTVNLLARAR